MSEIRQAEAARYCQACVGAPATACDACESAYLQCQTLLSRSTGERLACLAPYILTLISNSLALVWLGGTLLANVRRNLADQMLVTSLHDDVRRVRNLKGNPRWRFNHQWIGPPHLYMDGLALQARLVTDADYFERLCESLGDPLNHVEDQIAC